MVEERSGERASSTGSESPGRPNVRLRRRRKEIVNRLEGAGLIGGADASEEWRHDGQFGRRMSETLSALGPVFSVFGGYLVSRPDLLSPPDCLALAVRPERSQPTPPARVREQLERELGFSVGKLFSALDESPAVCGPLFQMHHAWLPDEGPATVKLLRPEWEVQWAEDEPLLVLVADAVARQTEGACSPTEIVEEFRASIWRQMDLASEAEALTALADDWDSGEAPLAPKVFGA